MATQTLQSLEMIEQLPPDSFLVLRGVRWEEYEALLAALGENRGVRVSFDQGRLAIMVLSSEHESYAELIKQLVVALSLRLRIKVLHFGSSTMKKREEGRGSEPDACFYVQNAGVIGSKKQIDFSVEPPPDIVVEVDLHHESLSKFPIYASLGVPEIWRYDGQSLVIHLLRGDHYVENEASLAFPILTSGRLSELLDRSEREDQYEILLAFEEWLASVTT
jgi:Uma2 family endonuclease